MGLNDPGITAKGDSAEARWCPHVPFPDLKASWPFTWSGCRDPTPGKQAVHTVDHIPSRCQLRSWGSCLKNIALKGATDVPLGVGSHFTPATQSCLKHTRTAQGWGSMILIFLISDKSLFFEGGLHFENSSKSLRFGVEIITVGNAILCFLKKKKSFDRKQGNKTFFFFFLVRLINLFWWGLLARWVPTLQFQVYSKAASWEWVSQRGCFERQHPEECADLDPAVQDSSLFHAFPTQLCSERGTH